MRAYKDQKVAVVFYLPIARCSLRYGSSNTISEPHANCNHHNSWTISNGVKTTPFTLLNDEIIGFYWAWAVFYYYCDWMILSNCLCFFLHNNSNCVDQTLEVCLTFDFMWTNKWNYPKKTTCSFILCESNIFSK